MTITNLKRPLTLAALTAALLIAGTGEASAGPVSLDVGQSASEVESYWTDARLRAAEPIPAATAGQPDPVVGDPDDSSGGAPTYVPPVRPGGDRAARLLSGPVEDVTAGRGSIEAVLDPTAKGVRAHGKVFFTLPKLQEPNDFVCSGTAVNSRNKSVVMTAGHCVFDAEGSGGKAANWIFVPGYQAGTEPYGAWTAKRLATTKQWKKDENLRFDLGAAVVRRDDAGRQLHTVVGARGIGFSQPRSQVFDVFGYPAISPFDGGTEYLCNSRSVGSDSPPGPGPNSMGIRCAMTGGSSGGGWVVNGKTLVSVISYGYDNEPGVLYGPYLSSTAKSLYKSVRGKR